MPDPPGPGPELGALHELAARHHVEAFSEGADGAPRPADPEALCAVLRVLGVDLGDPADAPAALAEHRAVAAPPLLEPVMVHRIGRPRPLRITLPRDVHPRDWRLVLELEDGTRREERLLTAISRPISGAEVAGRRIDGYELRLGASATFDIPPGYHRLVLESPSLTLSAFLISAPRCPTPARGWGAFLPLHALRTEEDHGVGTYRDLGALTRWVGGLGGSLVGTLPLYPSYLDERVEISPYQPVTRLGWNELFVDPSALPELAIAPEARDLLASPAMRERVANARRAVLVDHVAVMANLRQVLEPMVAALHRGPSARRAELDTFAATHPEVVAYARFRARTGTTEPGWAVGPGSGGGIAGAGAPYPHATPEHPSVPDAAVDPDRFRYHLYVQWAAEQQLADVASRAGSRPGAPRRPHVDDDQRAAGLYLDLPLGVHPGGFDPWWEPDAFARGVSGGAPPDAFFGGGQDWGFPPLHPAGIRRQEYRYPIAVLRHVLRHADAVRVDHVMGLHRLYWVPAGFDARHGVYVRYPADELRAVVALEASRAGVSVVGEDLGTVPPEVRTAMAQDGMLRSWVLQFESTTAVPLPEAPSAVMASWGTHDLPRFAAFWEGSDIDDRARRAELSPGAVEEARAGRAAWRRAIADALGPPGTGHERGGDDSPDHPLPPSPGAVLAGALEQVSAGPAQLVMVDLEDMWLERRPQNRPGTGAEAANWRRRAAHTLSEAAEDHALVARLGRIDAARRQLPAAPELRRLPS